MVTLYLFQIASYTSPYCPPPSLCFITISVLGSREIVIFHPQYSIIDFIMSLSPVWFHCDKDYNDQQKLRNHCKERSSECIEKTPVGLKSSALLVFALGHHDNKMGTTAGWQLDQEPDHHPWSKQQSARQKLMMRKTTSSPRTTEMKHCWWWRFTNEANLGEEAKSP